MSRRKLWEDHQCLQVDPCRLNNETLLSFDVGFPGTTHNEIRANEINKSTYTPFLSPSLSSVTNIYRGFFAQCSGKLLLALKVVYSVHY